MFYVYLFTQREKSSSLGSVWRKHMEDIFQLSLWCCISAQMNSAICWEQDSGDHKTSSGWQYRVWFSLKIRLLNGITTALTEFIKNELYIKWGIIFGNVHFCLVCCGTHSWMQGFQIKCLVIEMYFYNANSCHWTQSERLPNAFLFYTLLSKSSLC